LLLGSGPMTLVHLRLMFVLAAALGATNLVLGSLATRRENFQPRSRHVSPFGLLRRYHPGTVLLVAAATGFGLGLPGTFLRPYAESVNIPGIALFFSVYCPTAFAARFLARRLPARLGNRRVLHLGLCSMIVGMLLFTTATNQWLLCLPAVFLGVAHALLFPSVIADGTEGFPVRYRGLATTLVLAAFDIGTLVGSPMAGAILSYAGLVNLPPFPTMFVSVAAILGTIAAVYAISRPRTAIAAPASSAALARSVRPASSTTSRP
jgi:MFS family permease